MKQQEEGSNTNTSLNIPNSVKIGWNPAQINSTSKSKGVKKEMIVSKSKELTHYIGSKKNRYQRLRKLPKLVVISKLPENKEVNRTRIIVGSDQLKFQDNISTETAG